MGDILYIITPAYNEQENIKTVIEEWYPVIERHNGNGRSRLVIIDDGSKDRTYELITEAAGRHPLLLPVRKENEGHGATVLYGYQLAINHKADYIFQTDSDGQTLPSEFEEFWKIRTEYDLIIGNRKHRQDGLSRIIVTKVLKAVIFLCFKVDVADANTPFRLMSTVTLQRCIELVPHKFHLSNVVISAIYIKEKLRVKFLPITFRARQGGENSINIYKIVKIGKQALRDFRKINDLIEKDVKAHDSGNKKGSKWR